MKAFKYTLDKSSKKFACPQCGKKTLVAYRDLEGNFIDSKFGRCDREVNCGYFLKPTDDAPVFIPYTRPVPVEPSFIPPAHAIATYDNYENNNLIKYLIGRFGYDRIQALINQYRIGIDDSSPYTKDWVIFWQYDINNRIRSGKLIKYDATGHRDKQHAATWYHKRERRGELLFPDFNLKQCLFGEHLLATIRDKPIAIVESEKTALICSLFIDKYVWLACGGITQLSAEKVAVVANRTVTLFPDIGSSGKNGDYYIDILTDQWYLKSNGIWNRCAIVDGAVTTEGNGPPLSAFEKWKAKAREFNFNISDDIEKIATPDDRDKGLDLADYLMRW